MTTIPIKTLELKTERMVLEILRDAMRNVVTVDGIDHAIDRIETVGWDRMHDTVVTNHAAGYIAGGNLIRKHIRTAALTEHEDPRIAQHTWRLIYGLGQVADGRRNEIQAALRTYYERGYTYQQIARRMERFFDDDKIAARRFARTATNDVYNRAHLDRYEQSGVVDGVQYSAHIDPRTSDICRMLDGTIWSLDDPDIRTPPTHFNCCEAGTKIITADGHKNIEQIKIGDTVLTGMYRYMPVTDVMNRNVDDIIEIETENRKLRITPNHPIYTHNSWLNTEGIRKCGWIDAGDLKVADEITCLNFIGDPQHEEAIINVCKLREDSKGVYNLSVLQDESYYANGVLVHNCRSRLIPYFGKIPGKRDFAMEFGTDYVNGVEKQMDTFRSKYWIPFPRTKASSTFRRAYFDKKDILTLRDGLNILANEQRKRLMPDIIPIDLLKKRLRYRKIDPDPTTIVDMFGKGIMLDKFERMMIKDAISALIVAAWRRRDRLLKKGLGTLANAESTKIARYKGMLERALTSSPP